MPGPGGHGGHGRGPAPRGGHGPRPGGAPPRRPYHNPPPPPPRGHGRRAGCLSVVTLPIVATVGIVTALAAMH